MPLSVDAIAFLAMFAAYGIALHDNEFLVGIFFVALLIYIYSDLFLQTRRAFTVKLAALVLTIDLCVGALAIAAIAQHHANPGSLGTHDGMVQLEQAARMLLEGKNPYGENYAQTPMGLVPFQIGKLTENPALHHNTYLPFAFEFIAPFYWFFNSIAGWFDARFLFLSLFAGLLALAPRLADARDRRFALAATLGLNPFFVLYLIEGRNDILILFWITLSTVLLQAAHERASLIALGLACASKWTAWFLLPFYLLYFLQPPARMDWNWLRGHAIEFARRTLPLWLTIALLVAPFVFWNSAAFVDDVWNYPNGSSAVAPYPINGYGFNQLMRYLIGIQANEIRSPFEILQWVVGIPILILLSYRQMKRNTLSQMWLGYALLLAVMGFFSHVFNDNHIGYVLSLFALAIFSDGDRRRSVPGEKLA